MIFVNKCVDCGVEWTGDAFVCPQCNSMNTTGSKILETVSVPGGLELWFKRVIKVIKEKNGSV